MIAPHGFLRHLSCRLVGGNSSHVTPFVRYLCRSFDSGVVGSDLFPGRANGRLFPCLPGRGGHQHAGNKEEPCSQGAPDSGGYQVGEHGEIEHAEGGGTQLAGAPLWWIVTVVIICRMEYF